MHLAHYYTTLNHRSRVGIYLCDPKPVLQTTMQPCHPPPTPSGLQPQIPSWSKNRK